MKFYEIECIKCRARFNPPDEYFSEHSSVRKIIPKNIKVFRRHKPVVGKLADYEEIWDNENNRKIHRKLALTSDNYVEHEWEEKDGKLRPLNIASYSLYSLLVDNGRLKVKKKASIDEFAKDHFLYDEIQDIINEVRNLRHHQIKRIGDSVVIYVNNEDHKIEKTDNGYRIILLDRDHIDVDGSFCHNFTIECEDYEEIPMRAKVEINKTSDGRIEYILKCPECGAVAVKIVR